MGSNGSAQTFVKVAGRALHDFRAEDIKPENFMFKRVSAWTWICNRKFLVAFSNSDGKVAVSTASASRKLSAVVPRGEMHDDIAHGNLKQPGCSAQCASTCCKDPYAGS